MRITHHGCTPIELVSELSTQETCRWDDETDFFAGEKTKHNWLVEAWQHNLDEVLNCFSRYGVSAVNCQSIRDNGIDVYMKFPTGSGIHRVGFQLKSELEFIRARGTKEKHLVVGALKRQAYEAIHSGKVDEWWIVPCINYQKHASAIQQIYAEMVVGKVDNNRVLIRMLDPREAVSFLSKEDAEINTLCTMFLCADDEVLKAAVGEVADLSDFQSRCVLTLIFDALDGVKTIKADEFFYLLTGDEDAIEDDIGGLEDMGFMAHYGSDEFVINAFSFPAICALYFEGRVRHRMSHLQARSFVRGLVSNMEDED